MKSKVIAEKNFLPPIFFNKLKTILTDPKVIFPWYFEPMTAIDKYFTPDHEFMFTHVLYAHKQGPASSFFKDFEPIIYYLSNKAKVNQILRMHVNLYTNQNKHIKHGKHQDITDATEYYMSAVYHVNKCNGYTSILNKKTNSNMKELINSLITQEQKI